MNKKLLLSFAVFATAVSVNAQKSLYKGIAKNSMSVDFQTNAVIESKTEINPVVMGDFSSKKRLVTKTIKDTLAIAGNKKTYSHPHHAFSTNRTMKLKLYKSGNDTEFLSANQRYDNTHPLKLNGFGVSLTAYHDNTPVVALVTLRSKKTKQLDSIVPVELSINIAKTSSGTTTSSTRWFKPTTPISISDTFMIEVLPKVETDSVGITASGAYYGSTRAVAKIDGTTLTVNKDAAVNDSTYSGWATDKYGYFKGGFVAFNSPANDFFITGTNVLPGTYVTAQTGAYTYTVNKTQTVAETNISQNLKVYKTFNGLLGVKAVTAGKQSFDYYMAYDDGKKSLESDWLMYPDVEYTVSSDPKANDVCKDADGSVSVTFDASNRNVLENPTLNKLAFFQKYLGYDKTKNYYYSTVQNGKGSTKFVDMIDFKSTSLTINTKLDSLNKVDTLFMVDYILPYGFSKTAAAVTFGHLFPISSKVAPTTSITPVNPKCYLYDAKTVLPGLGGFAPYTGLPKSKDLAGKYSVVDANGCKGDITTTASFVVPDSLTIKTVSTSATNNTKSDGTIVATVTGGTTAYKYAWENTATKTVSTQTTATLTETAGTFKLTVTDANGCTKVATATIGDKKVSVTELGLTNIAVYPNPVKETLNVRFDATSIATVELVNVAGQVLDSKTNSDVTFNTAGLVAGMYFVNIKVAEGVYTHKIIKE